MGKSLIKKSNSLLKCRMNLDKTQQLIILKTVSQIKRNELNGTQFYRIPIKQFNDLITLKEDRLKKWCKELKEYTFEIQNIETGNWVWVSWFNDIEYKKETDELEVSFSRKLIPHLIQLKKENGGKFSSYFLENVSNFKSSYSIRIYELLMVVKNTSHKSLKIKIEDFFLMVGIDNPSMQKIVNLRREIMERVKKDINESSDLFFDYEFLKEGRGKKFTHIKLKSSINTTYEKNYYSEFQGLEKRLKEVLKYESLEYYYNDFYVDNIIEEYIEKVYIGKKFILNINGNDIYVLKGFERFDNQYKDREVYKEDGSLLMDDNNTTKHKYYMLYVERLDYYEELKEQFEKLIDLDYEGQDFKDKIEERENEYKFECNLNDSRELYYFLNQFLVDTNI